MDKAPPVPSFWLMWVASDSYMCVPFILTDNILTGKSCWIALHIKELDDWCNLYDLRIDLRVPALQKWSKISPANAASTDIDIVRTWWSSMRIVLMFWGMSWPNSLVRHGAGDDDDDDDDFFTSAQLVKRINGFEKYKKWAKLDPCFSFNKPTKQEILHFFVWSRPKFRTKWFSPYFWKESFAKIMVNLNI